MTNNYGTMNHLSAVGVGPLEVTAGVMWALHSRPKCTVIHVSDMISSNTPRTILDPSDRRSGTLKSGTLDIYQHQYEEKTKTAVTTDSTYLVQVGAQLMTCLSPVPFVAYPNPSEFYSSSRPVPSMEVIEAIMIYISVMRRNLSI